MIHLKWLIYNKILVVFMCVICSPRGVVTTIDNQLVAKIEI